MVTLNQIADLVIHDFSGGDKSKDSQMDRRDIILKARSYLNPILKLDYFGKMNEGDRSAIASAIATYEMTLSENDAQQKYFDLPDFFLTLPHNKGVHRIFAKGNPSTDYIMQQHPGVSGNLPHTKINNLQFFSVEGSRVVMGKGCTAKKADRLILQLIVPAPDTIADDDPLPLLKEHLGDVMARLKQDFAPLSQLPPDMANNQNPSIK